LGIKTKQDPSLLAKLVEDRDKFKLMPKSMGKLNIFGVKLEEERHPPMELPSQVGLHYFRLNRAETSKQIWDRVAAEKAMALRWPEADALDAEVGLYMTVP
jgi:predicted component of type VI protein secretion system